MPRHTQNAIGRRPWIKNPTAAVLIGLLVFIIGAVILYDAYERRGRRPPPILRPFLPV